jgi:hypothetical protein
MYSIAATGHSNSISCDSVPNQWQKVSRYAQRVINVAVTTLYRSYLPLSVPNLSNITQSPHNALKIGHLSR